MPQQVGSTSFFHGKILSPSCKQAYDLLSVGFKDKRDKSKRSKVLGDSHIADGSRQPTVAILEGMQGDEPELGHPCP